MCRGRRGRWGLGGVGDWVLWVLWVSWVAVLLEVWTGKGLWGIGEVECGGFGGLI